MCLPLSRSASLAPTEGIANAVPCSTGIGRKISSQFVAYMEAEKHREEFQAKTPMRCCIGNRLSHRSSVRSIAGCEKSRFRHCFEGRDFTPQKPFIFVIPIGLSPRGIRFSEFFRSLIGSSNDLDALPNLLIDRARQCPVFSSCARWWIDSPSTPVPFRTCSCTGASSFPGCLFRPAPVGRPGCHRRRGKN
jgi:hypothetical protein